MTNNVPNYKSNEIVEATELFPTLWVLQNNICNEMGMPIEFNKRKFLWDIYNDLSPLQVLLKPPQIGATVMNTLKSFFVAKKRGRQIIYTLPTSSDIQDMVGGSINRIIAQNQILSNWVKEHDTVEQKTVGQSMIFYRGTFTAKQAMMIPSGLNIHDEVDSSDADVITQYENRLQAQEDGGWRWYFSHPSIAGHGVDIYWQQSDKKEWFIKCPTCFHIQTLTFPDNLNFERKTYMCSSCKADLPDEARINGEWRPTAEGKFSGYHVSQLMLYNKSAEDIITSYNDPLKDKQFFWNYVLGLPYVGSENKIEPAVVLKNVTDTINDQDDRIIIGVDTGLPIYYTLVNKKGVFYYGKCKPPTATYDPYDTLEGLLIRYPKSVLISDQGGDLIGIRRLQAKYNGRVFLCYYRRDRKGKEMIKFGEHQDFGTVVVDRNRMIQLIVEQMRDTGRINLHGTVEDWTDFASHFGNIYRVAKETPFGIEYVWERSGPDHYVHALLYALVGLDKFAQSSATIIGLDNLSGIPTGRMFDNSLN